MTPSPIADDNAAQSQLALKTPPENNLPNSIMKPTLFFTALMAMISSFSALSIDIMLPALPAIGQSFQVNNLDLQQVVTYFVLGTFFGELIFGPASDRFGRRPLIILSSGIFLIGSFVCLLASSYDWLLFGRALQGVGAAGPKIVIRAMLRDLYSGVHLARVFSLVYTLFIFIPMIAPLLGQGISYVSSWQGIFVFLFVFALSSIIIFAVTQEETLAIEKRSSLNVIRLAKTAGRILVHFKVLMLTILTGVIFGIKLTYLSNAQQFFSDYYGIVGAFPLYFALLASAIGLAFFLNVRLVMTFGGKRLCFIALNMLVAMSLLLCCFTWLGGGVPHFAIFIISFYGMFFTFGILWGNVGALALEYLGNVAGLGSTLIAAGSSVVAFSIATLVGSFYGPSMLMISLSFFILALLGHLIFTLAMKSTHEHHVLAV